MLQCFYLNAYINLLLLWIELLLHTLTLITNNGLLLYSELSIEWTPLGPTQVY